MVTLRALLHLLMTYYDALFGYDADPVSLLDGPVEAVVPHQRRHGFVIIINIRGIFDNIITVFAFVGCCRWLVVAAAAAAAVGRGLSGTFGSVYKQKKEGRMESLIFRVEN